MQAYHPTKLGIIINKARVAMNLSLRDVERITGISNPYISQIESGKIQNPAFDKVVKLCDVYGIKLETLTTKETTND